MRWFIRIGLIAAVLAIFMPFFAPHAGGGEKKDPESISALIEIDSAPEEGAVGWRVFTLRVDTTKGDTFVGINFRDREVVELLALKFKAAEKAVPAQGKGRNKKAAVPAKPAEIVALVRKDQPSREFRTASEVAFRWIDQAPKGLVEGQKLKEGASAEVGTFALRTRLQPETAKALGFEYSTLAYVKITKARGGGYTLRVYRFNTDLAAAQVAAKERGESPPPTPPEEPEVLE